MGHYLLDRRYLYCSHLKCHSELNLTQDRTIVLFWQKQTHSQYWRSKWQIRSEEDKPKKKATRQTDRMARKRKKVCNMIQFFNVWRGHLEHKMFFFKDVHTSPGVYSVLNKIFCAKLYSWLKTKIKLIKCNTITKWATFS